MSSENTQWFYQRGNERKGPVSEEDIKILLKEGGINYGTLVWKNGFPEWLKIENTELSVHLKDVPPPLIPVQGTVEKARVNNIAVWFLAFGPLIGSFSEGFFTGLINGQSEMGKIQSTIDIINHRYWYIPFLVNAILLLADYLLLKQSKIDIKSIQKIIVIVPYYLYKRAQLLGDNLAYFIVWIVSFVLLFII